jgi:hypothetical protein
MSIRLPAAALLGGPVALFLLGAAPASPSSTDAPPAKAPSSSSSFVEIARVLQSPRCMNCHPVGNAPLQTDQSTPHKQNIQRSFTALGGSCNTCHQTANLAGAHMPPGAPVWKLPPAETPMVFQGKSPAQLCRDLKDPEKNGRRSLDQILHHVSDDELVKWGWNPGGGRTTPPLAHDAFVQRMTAWIAQGAPCPDEKAAAPQVEPSKPTLEVKK